MRTISKAALAAAAIIVATTTVARTDGISGSLMWQSDGISGIAKASGPPPVTCNQTGLDFTLNCNMILIPALIH